MKGSEATPPSLWVGHPLFCSGTPPPPWSANLVDRHGNSLLNAALDRLLPSSIWRSMWGWRGSGRT